MKRLTFAYPLALASCLLGCGPSSSYDGDPAAIQNRLTLEGFSSCEALEQYIEDEAVRDMNLQLDCQKDGSWCSHGFFAPEAADAASGAPSKSSSPSSFTKTNTQVAGVDEADFMKNDGTRIFVISGQKLHAVKSWPANEMALKGSLTLEGYPTEMFLDEKNRIVVFSSVFTPYEGFADGSGNGGGDVRGAACAPGFGGCDYYLTNTTKVTVVDATDISKLTVKSETYLPGSYTNSRRIDSSVRLVLRDSFRWPTKVRFYPEYSQGLYEDKSKLASTLDDLKVQNEQIIRAQTLEQWLPKAKRKLADGRTVELPYSCGDFRKSNAPVHLGLATVATMDLDAADATPSRTTIMGEVSEIYSSKDALYISTPHWWWWPRFGQKDYTYFHKFDLSDKASARYVASGGVEGHIIDQFAMDEHKGFFRVATTISQRVADTMNPSNTWGRIETTNRVSVLGENAGSLVVKGQSAELAKGETIRSARFIEDRGFVVTFRQVDPLFTFDLSNPSAPKQVGELKIPGFSSYIHPIDANHLLTMGIYMPDPGTGGMVDWNERRMQLSIFDVTNFANPQQTFTQTVGTAYGWSDAAYEHKAFNYFAERKMLAIPFSDYTGARGGDPWGTFVSDLRVFDIDVNTGIKARGGVSLKDVYISAGDPTFYYWYSPWVRRSVMASDAGVDYVYAVSDAGIRVANGASLSTPIKTVIFPKFVR